MKPLQDNSIAIVCAMREEAAAILKHLPACREERLNGKPYYEGEWQGQSLCLIVSRIGSRAAAKAVQSLVEHRRPRYLINFGTAGGLSLDIRVGEVVASRSVVDYSTSPPELFMGDEFLLQQALKIPGVRAGTIVSADKNIADLQERHRLGQTYQALACDWESAAVLRTAQYNNRQALSLRVISDTGQQPLTAEFQANLPKVLDGGVKVLLELINKII